MSVLGIGTFGWKAGLLKVNYLQQATHITTAKWASFPNLKDEPSETTITSHPNDD
jgi:hypothetical protein